MKVAVPLFGSVVAPRFGFANEFLVALVVDHEITRTERIAIDTLEWHGRLAALQGRGITVLLCGGFNRRFDPLAESMGIEVIAGLAGDADAVVATFARGEELPVSHRCRFRRRDGSGRGRGGGQGRDSGRCRRE
jgi:predicted Fe-Mo cluster-binding NifX family protein